MKEFFILFAIYLLFSLIGYLVYKWVLAVGKLWSLIILSIYLFGIYYYFELFNQIHNYLRNNKLFYVEFGHGSIDLLLLMLFCYLQAFAMIVVLVLKRFKDRKPA